MVCRFGKFTQKPRDTGREAHYSRYFCWWWRGNYLGNALVKNDTLKQFNFYLEENESITSTGWVAFLRCLANPNSPLEDLDLPVTGNTTNDEAIIGFAHALATVIHALATVIQNNCDLTLLATLRRVDGLHFLIFSTTNQALTASMYPIVYFRRLAAGTGRSCFSLANESKRK